MLGDIGNAIQEYAENFGYSVVRDFCGHGIGKVFHCAPNFYFILKKDRVAVKRRNDIYYRTND